MRDGLERRTLFLAVMGAFALQAVWENPRFGPALRAGVVGVFLLAAALPIRAEPIEALLLGEHRMSETLSIDLRAAEFGFWGGYPDSRTIITAPQAELVERLRDEVAAGRLQSTTPVLHVAFNFQQWDATPIGVLAGWWKRWCRSRPRSASTPPAAASIRWTIWTLSCRRDTRMSSSSHKTCPMASVSGSWAPAIGRFLSTVRAKYMWLFQAARHTI